jgi:hypothetical protein
MLTTEFHMNYVECDIPADVTLPEWRRARAAARPTRRRLWQRARSSA